MTSRVPSLTEISFETAIEFTETWLEQVAEGTLTEEEIWADLTTLLSHREGVRGFFVCFLTGNSPLADAPPFIFLQAFAAMAEPHLSSILVKNLAMSTAMVLTHYRNGHTVEQEGSQRVQHRSFYLLQALDAFEVESLHRERWALLEALEQNTGDYQKFLDRWGYDGEQRGAIQEVIQALTERNGV
jgi:hypothetical protein